MNKTIHQKLANKINYTHPAGYSTSYADDFHAGLELELKMLQHAAKDLLSPRPEAVNRLMQLSRSL